MKELAEVIDSVEAHNYPATTEELMEEYGELEIEHPNGGESLADVLDRLDSETFRTAEQARMAVYSSLDGDAIGRKNYSDRDPISPGEDGPPPLSL